jgi:hypothetical protein
MLFCPGPSHGRALFVCPKCLEQPKKGYDKAVTQAMKTFISTIENLKKQTILEEQSTPESSIHVKSALEYKNEDKTKKEAVKDLWMGEDPVMEFDIVREERYNSFDDNLVYDLLRNLHQYIYDYDIEIGDAIERFGNESDLRMKEPLRAWKLVDVNEGIVTGQQWFRIDDVTTKQPTCHAPITAALRSILNTSDDKPLGIALNLKSLTFSQVHIGLVNWFVFDVLNNKINLYELPNMRSMRAMMTAVRGSGEASKYAQLLYMTPLKVI